MKTEPIAPAHIEFGDVPFSPLYGDAYHHPSRGALERARQVFLQGTDLPARWAGCLSFTILETGFGLGNNFLATWEAWRTDPRRCERLTFVSIERHPPLATDLAHAHAASTLPALAEKLIATWPPLTPNLHVIEFEGGSVQLLLGLGDVAALLPELRARPDAFFLDGFAPASNPQMWQTRVLKALGRMASPGATLATWNTAPELRAGLTSAGFEVDSAQDEITLARHAPRFARVQRQTPAVGGDRAVVVGAGIAGAAAALALSRAGLDVTVIDREAEPATCTSGNPAGLFHGTIHADDGPHARLFRAAALVARNEYGKASRGLLRLGASLSTMQTLLREQGLPADYVQALSAGDACALAGVALPGPAWFYPGAGWLDPAGWVRQQLALPHVRWMGLTRIARLARDAQGCWQLHDANDRLVASAPIVVLANAAGAAPLLLPMGHPPWPVTHSRGQVTMYRPEVAGLPRLPVGGDGYAIALEDGRLLCGATRGEDQPAEDSQSTEVREADHHQNLSRLERLTGIVAPADPSLWSGRSGWRLQTADRLPIAGAVPLARMPPGQRMDQVRMLPRERGLFVLTALGARGLTLAPLLGRLVAAQATGLPWPLEQDLADAVDPARWLVRAARRAPAGDR